MSCVLVAAMGLGWLCDAVSSVSTTRATHRSRQAHSAAVFLDFGVVRCDDIGYGKRAWSINGGQLLIEFLR